MAQEAPYQTTSPAELFQAAEAVVRSGRRETVRLHGMTLTIDLAASQPRPRRVRRRQHDNDAFLAASGALPALSPPRDLTAMTELAAEEAAQAAAVAGLPPHDHA